MSSDFVTEFDESKGDLSIVTRALAQGKDINQGDENGMTVLRHACLRWGEVKHVSFLLDNGADVNHARLDGYTPLHWASYDGNAEVCQLLLERGANINQTNENGKTPLYYACSLGRLAACKLLMKYGADQTLVDKHGRSALDRARDNRKQDIVAFFYRISVMVYTLHARSKKKRHHVLVLLPLDVLKRVFAALSLYE